MKELSKFIVSDVSFSTRTEVCVLISCMNFPILICPLPARIYLTYPSVRPIHLHLRFV
jgi:hypothetical protein